jgi:hypothetical protein
LSGGDFNRVHQLRKAADGTVAILGYDGLVATGASDFHTSMSLSYSAATRATQNIEPLEKRFQRTTCPVFEGEQNEYVCVGNHPRLPASSTVIS